LNAVDKVYHLILWSARHRGRDNSSYTVWYLSW